MKEGLASLARSFSQEVFSSVSTSAGCTASNKNRECNPKLLKVFSKRQIFGSVQLALLDSCCHEALSSSIGELCVIYTNLRRKSHKN